MLRAKEQRPRRAQGAGSAALSRGSRTRRCLPAAAVISTISACAPARSKPLFCARRMRTPKSRRSMARRRWRPTAYLPCSPAPKSRRSPRAWWSASRPRSSAGRSPSIACAMSASRSQSWSPPTATAPRMRSISSRSAIAHCRRWSIRSPPQRRARRFSIPAPRATSSASAAFATAIRKAPLPPPRTASASRCATRAIHARRSRPMASSPNTMPPRTPTTSSPISRGRSACIR